MQPGGKSESIVVSALTARTGFGKMLRRVEDEHRSLVIEKRGTPRAVLLSIRDYVRLATPEPEVLRVIGEQSRRKGTDKLTSRQIDQVHYGSARAKTQAPMIQAALTDDVSPAPLGQTRGGLPNTRRRIAKSL